MLKRTILLLLAGGGLGLIASMWFGPAIISWWFTPPGSQGMFTCEPQVRAATEQLVKIQLIVGGIMGVLLAIIGNLIVHKRKPAAPIATTTTTAPPTTPTPEA